MSNMIMSAIGSTLRSWAGDILHYLGVGGIVCVLAGIVLLLGLSFKSIKLMSGPGGIAIAVVALVLGLAVMWRGWSAGKPEKLQEPQPELQASLEEPEPETQPQPVPAAQAKQQPFPVLVPVIASSPPMMMPPMPSGPMMNPSSMHMPSGGSMGGSAMQPQHVAGNLVKPGTAASSIVHPSPSPSPAPAPQTAVAPQAAAHAASPPPAQQASPSPAAGQQGQPLNPLTAAAKKAQTTNTPTTLAQNSQQTQASGPLAGMGAQALALQPTQQEQPLTKQQVRQQAKAAKKQQKGLGGLRKGGRQAGGMGHTGGMRHGGGHR